MHHRLGGGVGGYASTTKPAFYLMTPWVDMLLFSYLVGSKHITKNLMLSPCIKKNLVFWL